MLVYVPVCVLSINSDVCTMVIVTPTLQLNYGVIPPQNGIEYVTLVKNFEYIFVSSLDPHSVNLST